MKFDKVTVFLNLQYFYVCSISIFLVFLYFQYFCISVFAVFLYSQVATIGGEWVPAAQPAKVKVSSRWWWSVQLDCAGEFFDDDGDDEDDEDGEDGEDGENDDEDLAC